jgi:hypothetical protein
MDTMTNLVTLYLIIGPSGAAFSVDRLLLHYRAARRAAREHRPVQPLARPEPSVSANLALRLLQVHFCIIYLVAGVSKLQGAPWWNGTAVWATMANFEFCPMQRRPYAAFLVFLSGHRWLWEVFTTGATMYTLVFEISFPFIVWNRRLRWLAIVGAVLLHTGIALCMGLVTFSLVMLTGVLSFVPAAVVYRLRRRWRY